MMTLNAVESTARLTEAMGLLDEMSLVLLRFTSGDAQLEALREQIQDFIHGDDGLPLAEAIQNAQDFREAVGQYGFNPSHSIVATAWADLCTSLSEVFLG